jgi:hypothetical protein
MVWVWGEGRDMLNFRGVGEVHGGDILARKESVVAALEHEAGKVAHNRLGLKVKVPEHFVRAPASNEADDVGVNVGKEKGHCTAGAEGSSIDVVGE